MAAVLIHYHELTLKGKNRGTFERRLADEMRVFLKPFTNLKITRLGGRALIEGKGNPTDWINVLKTVPGIADLREVIKLPATIDDLCREIPPLVKAETGQSFAIRARRDRKDYPFTSVDLGREVGAIVAETHSLTVDLDAPDLEITIEIANNMAYVGADSLVRGARGLPVGTSRRAVALLSGGFDSPVAAHLMQCRGMRLSAIHCHSAPMVSRASLDKVKELCEVLGRSQSTLRLVLVPIVDFQNRVVAHAPESLRLLLYRRFMVRLACHQAKLTKAAALVSGDALGQVASQTLDNMEAVGAVADRPILRPLIGMTKEWIIDRSRDIQTHDISVLPHDDCCGFLMPKNPATTASAERLAAAEEGLDIEASLALCWEARQEITYECGRPR